MRLRTTLTTSATALLLAALTIAGASVSKADTIDWAANFGAEGNSIPNGSVAVSNSGLLTALITLAGGGDGQVMVEGSEWDGNFVDGASLFWTGDPGQGPITLDFSQPVTAVSFQIQADYFGPFTAGVLAYSQGNLVDSVFATGDSNSNGDGSALSLGLTASSGFTKIRIVQPDCACDTGDFAISQVNVSPVPEPGSLTFMFVAAGAAALFGYRRRRKPVETSTALEFLKGKV